MLTRERVLDLPAPRPRVVEEAASVSLETRRIPDPYYFIITSDGLLLDPSSGQRIDDFIEKDSYVGRLEYEAFLEIKRLVGLGDTRRFLWISPPSFDRYPFPKIIISEIVQRGKVKILFNRAIILEGRRNDCLEIANQLFLRTGGGVFVNIEEVRRRVLLLPHLGEVHWTYFLSEFIYAPEAWKKIRDGADLKEKNRALATAEKIWRKSGRREMIEKSLKESGLMGEYGDSCPTSMTAFGFFLKYTLFIEGFFTCPRCNKRLPAGVGISICPFCGADKKDYGFCI